MSFFQSILFFRILEFENLNPGGGHGRNSAVEVELWDCSGDSRLVNYNHATTSLAKR